MNMRFKEIQFKGSEIVILVVVSLMGFLANLPETYGGRLIDRKLILASLIAVVVIAMFRYLQMLLLMVIVILSIGANLPADMAQALGISQLALLFALGSMVVITLANRIFNLLPTDSQSDAAQSSDTVVPDFDTFVPDLNNARQFMLTAISKGDSAALRLLLAMNASINFVLNGTTPLHLAAEKGYSNIVQLLLDHGADPHALNAERKTPLEVALAKKKFARTTEILFSVTKFVPAQQE